MADILAPLTPGYTLIIPDHPGILIAWVIGLIALVILVVLLRERTFKLNRASLSWFAGLSLLILILTPFMGVFPRMSPIIAPGEAPFRHLMFFAAIPWMVGAGVLGLAPATFLAGISGLLLAYSDTHNIFTPLVMMIAAIVYSWCIRQRYRTNFYTWLRHPIIAAIASMLASSPSVFLVLILCASGSTGARIGMAITRFPVVMFTLGGMLLIGGATCMIVQALAAKYWAPKTPLKPAPGEVHFRYRLLSYATPIFLIVLVGVLLATWSLGQNHARKQILKQLTGTTAIAAESLGVFLTTGDQILDALAANPQMSVGSDEQISAFLQEAQSVSNFFEWLAVLDAEGHLIAGYLPSLSPDILRDDDLFQPMTVNNKPGPVHFFVTGLEDENYGLMCFITGVERQPDTQQRFLWGLTKIDENRVAQPLVIAKNALKDQGGTISVIDAGGRVVFHWNSDDRVEEIPTANLTTSAFFQGASSDGRLMLNYYQPAAGTDWGLTANLPALVIQEMAWELTRTNLLIAGGVMIFIFVMAWIGLTPIVNELESMSLAINAVLAGGYDPGQLKERAYPDRGYLKTAFRNMITIQQKRMDQQKKLSSASVKVAERQNLAETLHMILAAALVDGVCAARVVLVNSDSTTEALLSEHRFGIGSHANVLAAWDQAMAGLVLKSGAQTLNHDEILKQLPPIENRPEIASVNLLPLKWEASHLGVMWVAFTDNDDPDEAIMTFLKQLAHLASLAVINARTYRDSQLSTALIMTAFDLLTDAVLITDQNNQVLLHNKKARQLFFDRDGRFEGEFLNNLLSQHGLSKQNLYLDQKVKSKEVQLHDGNLYDLIYSPIQIDENQHANAIIIKDLASQREADALKTEFVTMVSHELRSPLTLILGYAKILRLTGNLNEQQDSYISNIINGVEGMKELVQKLLDMGRLEDGDPLEIHPVTAEQIIARTMESLKAKAKQKQISLLVDLPETPITIYGDQVFLAQALRNLIDNGIKSSKMGGEVLVTVTEMDERVVFAVQDQGIGIAPLDQRKLFRKFSRITTDAEADDEGSGLGLAIVKSIAERHGGEVRVESQLGKGSIFYFEIPRKYSA
jgi:signal transduction histidine kinase